jgi:murein hydrolase activator
MKPAGIAAVAALVLLLSPSGDAPAQKESVESISNRIEKIQKEIEQSKREIEKGERAIRDIRKKKQSVQEEVRRQEKNIRVVESNIARLEREERQLKVARDAATNRLTDAQKVLALRSAEFKDRIRSMYKRQRISIPEIMFGAGSVSTMLRGFRMLHDLAVADTRVLETLRGQNRIIETEMNTLRIAIDTNIVLETAKRREQSSLANAREKRLELLGEIDRDQRVQEEKTLKWKEELRQSEELMDRLLQEQIAKKKTVVPGSLKNYSFAGRKGKLPWPVAGKVVSGYGQVVDPKTNTVTINRGVEFETRRGEQVCTIGSGQVVKIQSIRGYGNFVMIHHFPNYYTIYAHLSDILVSEGDIVHEGSVIGLAGSTGLVDDRVSRLLVEILRGRNPENPLSWLRPDRRASGI